MDTSTLRALFRHMEWADATLWTVIITTEQALTDTKLRDYLYHLHLVQRAFLRIWHGDSPEAHYPKFGDLHTLLEWARGYYPEAFGCLETTSDEKLAETLSVPWAAMVEGRLGRKPEPTTLGDTMYQVVLHSTYHRGQINARLREVGGEPPLVDYIAWIWLGKPDADWSRISAGPGQ